jgi:16S rRNA processing protein RimM
LNKDSPEKLILMGKVVRPHGIEGIFRIKSYAQSEESFLHAGSVFLKLDRQEPVEFKVLSIKPHKGLFLLKLSGIDSIEKAGYFRGADIYISKNHLKRKNTDEYFWYELKGITVYLNTGKLLGRIKEIIATGSNDIFVVKSETSEFLIPAVNEVVESIDLENRKMIISDMEGLLDLNEV